MKLYSASSYGRLNLMVRPGVLEPDNDGWFEMVPGEYGELRRRARTILVKFQDGAAEVDDELGRYLLEREQIIVSAEPVPFAFPPAVDAPVEWMAIYETAARKAPTAVGQTMPPEVAASQTRRMGEPMKWR